MFNCPSQGIINKFLVILSARLGFEIFYHPCINKNRLSLWYWFKPDAENGTFHILPGNLWILVMFIRDRRSMHDSVRGRDWCNPATVYRAHRILHSRQDRRVTRGV